MAKVQDGLSGLHWHAFAAVHVQLRESYFIPQHTHVNINHIHREILHIIRPMHIKCMLVKISFSSLHFEHPETPFATPTGLLKVPNLYRTTFMATHLTAEFMDHLP